MRLDAFLLADAITVPPDGKVYIHGGGFTRLAVPELPFTLAQLAILVRLEITPEDLFETHRYEVRLLDPVGDPVAEPMIVQIQGRTLEERPEGEERFLQLVLQAVGTTFTTFGVHVIELLIDDESVRRMTLPVLPRPEGDGPAAI